MVVVSESLRLNHKKEVVLNHNLLIESSFYVPFSNVWGHIKDLKLRGIFQAQSIS